MAAAIQVGLLSKDASLLQSLKNVTFKAGDADVSLVSPADLCPMPTFSQERYKDALHSRSLGQTLLVTASIPSTQTLLHQNFSTFPDGTVCIADTQTSGKGRGSNTWVSPMGCLMFSVYKSLAIAGQCLPFVQYAVSLAIVSAIRQICKPYTKDSPLDIRIKWPNDIYANKLKIGGILCQSVYRDGSFHVTIGAGLNVNNEEPTTCLKALINDILGHNTVPKEGISREVLLAQIAFELEQVLQQLTDQGFDCLRDQYLQFWLHTGQKVVLEESPEGVQKSIPLTIMGISDSGYLNAKDEKGEIFELHPDGNSLDFFAGLVRHKK